MRVENLRKYRENKEELESIERQLREKYANEDMVQASKGAPTYEKTTRLAEGYIPGSGAGELLARQTELENENRQIKDFINAIPKKRVHKALYIYCIDDDYDNPTWDEVAVAMNEISTRALSKYVRKYLKDRFS